MTERHPQDLEEPHLSRVNRVGRLVGRVVVSTIVAFIVIGSTAASEVFPPGVPFSLGIASWVGSYMLMEKFSNRK